MPKSIFLLGSGLSLSARYCISLPTSPFFRIVLLFFPKRHFRLDYTLYAYTFPSYLWGLSYPQSDNDDNKSKYSHDKLEVMTRLLARLNRYSYVGPIVRYQLVHAYKLKDRAPQLLEGQPMTVNDIGVGLSYTFDSRDFILNASKGWFLQLDLMTY